MKKTILIVAIAIICCISCDRQKETKPANRFPGFTKIGSTGEGAKLYLDLNSAKREGFKVTFKFIRLVEGGYVIQEGATDCRNLFQGYDGVQYRDDGTSDRKYPGDVNLQLYQNQSGIAELVKVACSKTGDNIVWMSTQPQTEDQKAFYALGAHLNKQLSVFDLTPEELSYVQQGMYDAAVGKKLTAEPEANMKKLSELIQDRALKKSDRKLGTDQKAFYALGAHLNKQLSVFDLTPEELNYVQQGMYDAAVGKKLAAEPEANMPKLAAMIQSRMAKATEKQKAQSKAFLEKAATEKGAIKTPSGLIYSEIKPGTGAQPKTTDTVTVHYVGNLIDGKEFDSSIKRGQPAILPLKKVFPCWAEGVAMMKVGGKSKLVCPSEIAYGDKGRPPVIPGGAALVFEVELLDVKAP